MDGLYRACQGLIPGEHRAYTHRVDVILGGDTVRRQEVDSLGRAEPSVLHTGQDLVDRILRQRDQTIGRHLGVVGTTCEELEAGATTTVAHTHGTCELNAANGDVFSDTSEEGKQGKYAETYKSPKETLCLSAKGFCSPTISSKPVLAWNLVSMSAKAMIEPSAPPPLGGRISTTAQRTVLL